MLFALPEVSRSNVFRFAAVMPLLSAGYGMHEHAGPPLFLPIMARWTSEDSDKVFNKRIIEFLNYARNKVYLEGASRSLHMFRNASQ